MVRKNGTKTCRVCFRARQKDYRLANPEKNAKKQRGTSLRRLGWTSESFEAAKAAQNNRCAICQKEEVGKELAADHNHENGHPRGLLCSKCNTALGLFFDNLLLLNAAINYLTKHSK